MKQPELGQRILALRTQKGLTQDELVELCNINVRTLQRIENGEVTPRSYTIKTILTALDYDFESLQLEQTSDNDKRKLVVNAKEAPSVLTLLNMAWISGILFALTAVFEGFTDFIRINDDEFIFGMWGHISIKILVILFNGLLFYGFLIAGNLLKNHLMKVSAILMILVLLGFYVFDMLSVFYIGLDIQIILVAQSICFGIVGILFGISILQSRNTLGNIGLASGIAELILATCLLSVLLIPAALFLIFPVIVLEILVLYKITAMVKENLA